MDQHIKQMLGWYYQGWRFFWERSSNKMFQSCPVGSHRFPIHSIWEVKQLIRSYNIIKDPWSLWHVNFLGFPFYGGITPLRFSNRFSLIFHFELIQISSKCNISCQFSLVSSTKALTKNSLHLYNIRFL